MNKNIIDTRAAGELLNKVIKNHGFESPLTIEVARYIEWGVDLESIEEYIKLYEETDFTEFGFDF